MRKFFALPALASLMLLVALLAGPGLVSSDDGQPAPLFSAVAGENSSPKIASNSQDLIRQRPVAVNIENLGRQDGSGRQAGQPLVLNLFADAVFSAIPDRIYSEAPGKLLWSGSVVGVDNSTVTIAVDGSAASGTFWIDGQLYKLASRAGSSQVINEVEPAAPLPEMQPVAIDAPPIESHLSAVDGGLSAEADDGSVIDVLVVYTPGARFAVGGSSQMAALIDLAVDETNQAYENSEIGTELRLVHAAELAYAESGDYRTDLARIIGKTDGFMDQVHALRDIYAADIVSLIINSNQYCGVAYLMNSLSSGFEAIAFSVVYWKCATGYYSFAHEIGHLQGSHHERGVNAPSTPLFDYSYGYQAPDQTFRTIMAYYCGENCQRVQHFSNPRVNYAGQPTGIDHNSNPANSADNARSINNALFTVANFRVSNPPPPDPPLAPGNLVAETISFHEISLTWENNANNADGIIVERQRVGGSWITIAILPASHNSYLDPKLGPQSSNNYRVQAYNLGGNSDYSNVALATTSAANNSFYLPALIHQ